MSAWVVAATISVQGAWVIANVIALVLATSDTAVAVARAASVYSLIVLVTSAVMAWEAR